MTEKMYDGTAYCRLVCRPSADLISVIRHFVSNFFDQLLEDNDVAQRAALATHELLENAVKYSSDGEAVLVLELSPDKEVHARISNRASNDHIQVLKQAFEEMGDDDPATYYVKLMRKNKHRTDGSGLGLARIQAEADMKLTLEVAGDSVTLDAVGHGERKVAA
jgi:hypothetical protein